MKSIRCNGIPVLVAIPALVLFACACSGSEGGTDAGAGDASLDGGADSGTDAGADAGTDAGTDGGSDGGVVKKAEVMVEMRDGVKLNTRIYTPEPMPAGGLPVVLERTPYGFPSDEAGSDELGTFFADNGYIYILQDVRGRFKSEGKFEPLKNEIADGQDTTKWVVKQSWSNGKIGTWGGSYTGYTAVATAIGNPLVLAVVADDAAADFKFDFIGGAFSLHPLNWLYLLDDGDWMGGEDIAKMTNALDLAGLDQTMLGHVGEFYRQLLAIEGNPTSSYWNDRSLDGKFKDLCAPLLSVLSFPAQWTDPLRIWRGAAVEGCEAQRKNARLVVTSEGHCWHMGVLRIKRTPVNQLMMDYLDTYLKGADTGLSKVPATVYHSPGERDYRASESWPKSDAEKTYYLRNDSGDPAGGSLLPDAPQAEDPDTVSLDPENMDPCADYPYFVYISEAAAEPVYISGAPKVEMWVSSTAKDADFFAFLMEYDLDTGYYSFIESAAVRARYRNGYDTPEPLTPGAPVKLAFEFSPTTYRIQAGRSVMLYVMNGSCGSSENALTGEALSTQTKWGTADASVLHDSAYPSKVVLPLQNTASDSWYYDVVKLDCPLPADYLKPRGGSRMTFKLKGRLSDLREPAGTDSLRSVQGLSPSGVPSLLFPLRPSPIQRDRIDPRFRFSGSVKGYGSRYPAPSASPAAASAERYYADSSYDAMLNGTVYIPDDYVAYADLLTVGEGPDAGKDLVSTVSLGSFTELSSSHFAFVSAEALVKRELLVQMKSEGRQKTASAADFGVKLSVLEEKVTSFFVYIKKCPLAAGDTGDAEGSLFLCNAGNKDFGPGETLELAGNIRLLDKTADDCVCLKEDTIIDCKEFDKLP